MDPERIRLLIEQGLAGLSRAGARWSLAAAGGLMPGGPVTPNTVLTDWNDIASYVKSIRPPRAARVRAAAAMAAR